MAYFGAKGNPVIGGAFMRCRVTAASLIQTITGAAGRIVSGLVSLVLGSAAVQANTASSVQLVVGEIINSSFTNGTPGEVSLAAYFPAIAGTEQSIAVTSGSLPSGVTLDPIGKRLVYDGTPGLASVSATITGKANAPKLSFSNATGVIPVMAGIAFPKGVVSGSLGSSEANLRVVTRRSWNDGSIKHAVVVGTCDASAVVTFNTSPASGSNMAASDIAAAAPTAVVDLGSLGTADLSTLLATPFETWIATSKFVECHYRWTSSVNTAIAVEFQVRLWHNGVLWVRANVENSKRLRTNGSGSYNVPITGSVTLFGTTVQTYSATALYENTQHIHERWAGGTQYDIVVVHDTKQVTRTKLVPEYGMVSAITESRLASLPQTYAINSSLGFTPSMGAAGYQDQIGMLPTWDACYLVSGDARAYRSVLAHGKAGFNYPILWRESGRMLTPADYPTANYAGVGQGGTEGLSAGSLTWEQAHHPSMGYLAYLLTGDALYEDAMLGQLATNFQVISASANRVCYWGQTRGTAWTKRTIANAAGLAHDGAAELAPAKAWFKAHVDYYTSKTLDEPLAVNSDLGYPVVVSTYNASLPQTVAPWMHNFWIAAMGYASDVEPVDSADMAKLVALRDWMYRGIVGFLGDGSSGHFCYTYLADYRLTISPEVVGAFTVRFAKDIYQSWGDVMLATHGSVSCGTTVSFNASEHYADVGMAMPAVAYAVDHAASGMSAAYSRLTSATGWSTFLANAWGQQPVWGVAPRTATPVSLRTANVTIAADPDDFGLLGTAVAGMTAGAWLNYTSTNINDKVSYADTPVQADAPFSALETQANYPLTLWANKWFFDPATKQLGGVGTAQGFISESPTGTHSKAVWFDLLTNSFFQDWNPTGKAEGHIYDGNSSRALNGYVYRRAFGGTSIWRCDVSTKVWSNSGLSHSGVYAYDACGLDVFPDWGTSGSLLMIGGAAGNGSLFRWDLSTGTRTSLGSFPVGDYPVLFYVEALQCIVFGGGSAATGKLYTLDKFGTITQISTTLPAGINCAGSGPLLPDPLGRALVWFISHNLNKIYKMDIATGVWTDCGAVPSGLNGKINYSVGITLHGLGAIVILNGSGRGGDTNTYSKFWLYKV